MSCDVPRRCVWREAILLDATANLELREPEHCTSRPHSNIQVDMSQEVVLCTFHSWTVLSRATSGTTCVATVQIYPLCSPAFMASPAKSTAPGTARLHGPVSDVSRFTKKLFTAAIYQTLVGRLSRPECLHILKRRRAQHAQTSRQRVTCILVMPSSVKFGLFHAVPVGFV